MKISSFRRNITCIVACMALLACVRSSRATPQTITNNAVWNDTSGNEIICQCGSMLQVGNTFYFYGSDIINYDIRCYSSTDLKNWTYRGIMYNGTGWCGRPDVLYNSGTGKYVMISEGSGISSRNGLMYFTATSPTGPFTYQRGDSTIFGQSMGDHSVFKDTNNNAYLVAVTDDGGVTNGTLKIVKLNSDYLGLNSVTYTWTYAATGDGYREAPAIFKNGSTYYLFTSHTSGWSSSATMYRKSTSLSSGWTTNTVVPTTPTSSDSYNTQHDFVFPVTGTAGTTYIYAGDRWSQKTGIGVGKNEWFPVFIDADGVPTIYGYGQWSIDTSTGLWSANNGGVLPDGTYKIVNMNSGKSLQVYNHGTVNGSAIQQGTYASDANQKWTIFHLGSNVYKIYGVESGRSIEISGSSTADGALADIWGYAGWNSEKWTLGALSGGYYSITNVNSGKALNVTGSSTADGATIGQWTYNAWASQKWMFQAP